MKRSPRNTTTADRQIRRGSPVTNRSASGSAQLASEHGLHIPTRDDLLRMIRNRQRRGRSLRREDVEHQEPRLERAGHEHFGSWREAVEAAGFRLTGSQRWDHERVLAEIRTLHQRGASLAYSRAPARLLRAARLHFGSWRLAIEGAGLDYKSVRLSKSNEDVIALLLKGARSGRTGLGPGGFVDWAVYDLARRRFGSFRAALEAAGLDPAQLLRVLHGRYSTDESIAAELRRLAHEHPDMTLAQLHRADVADAAKRRYGSLQAAVAALGIAGWPQRRAFPSLSADEIVAGIQERHRRGDSMRATLALATDPRLTMAAYRRFGSWRAAMRAAGLGALVEDGPWNRGSIRAELKGRRLRREALSKQAIQRDDPQLWSAVVMRYGNLAQALRDADRPRRKAATRSRARSR